MHKRGVLSILFGLFLLFLPSTLAQITVSGPEQTLVNFGDAITLTGSIVQATDMNGFLKFELSCGETDLLATKSLNLRTNTVKEFTETLTIPQTLTGSCTVHTFFEENGNTVDEAQSNIFTVSNALNAPIIMNKESVQLGDSVSLSGTITKMNGDVIEGIGKIAFKQGKNVVVQDTVRITKGKFSYTYETEDNPSGTYEVQVEVTDVNNNKQIVAFPNFVILGNVGLTITLNKNEFLPGEKVKIDGTARTGDSRITKGTAYITLDGQREETTILLGLLKHTINLPTNIKTGEHTITVDVEDTHGNKETQQFIIFITAVPTRLEVLTNQEVFMPEQQVALTPALYDQGNDVIATAIEINVLDAERDIVFTDTLQSTEKTLFTLPRSAAPGFWKVKASAMDVETFISFQVQEFKVLEITQQDSLIFFSNTGNVPIKEMLTLTITDGIDKTRTKDKKVSLAVGESKNYDIAYLVGKGTYTVQVGDKTFENVIVEKRKWNFLPLIAIILGVIIIYFLIKLFVNRKPLRHKIHTDQQKHHLQPHHPQKVQEQQPIVRQRSQEWYEEKLKRDLAERMEAQKKKVTFSFKKRKDEYVASLKNKKKSADMSRPWVRKPIKEAEAEPEVFTNSQEFSDPWKTTEEPPKKEKKEEKGSSLMGMFD
ncbi:MAG: hypothetical protein Q8L34_04855 [Candidatus Woesearchaeota archaeon]|nr:hypothetical protein [Candidatus Woesearchaeota archaeon]